MAKTKALISFAVTASLFSHIQKAGFLTMQLKSSNIFVFTIEALLPVLQIVVA